MEFKIAGGHVVQVDEIDFWTLSHHCWRLDSDGYVIRTVKGRRVALHNEIMRPPNGMMVDHVHGNKLDCRRSQMRVCTHQQNLQNSAISKNNTTGYKGVSKTKSGKYCAKITVNKKAVNLGEYKTAIEAARAYDIAAIQYFGDFARLNLSEDQAADLVYEVVTLDSVP